MPLATLTPSSAANAVSETQVAANITSTALAPHESEAGIPCPTDVHPIADDCDLTLVLSTRSNESSHHINAGDGLELVDSQHLTKSRNVLLSCNTESTFLFLAQGVFRCRPAARAWSQRWARSVGDAPSGARKSPVRSCCPSVLRTMSTSRAGRPAARRTIEGTEAEAAEKIIKPPLRRPDRAAPGDRQGFSNLH